jgi:hypothetical protein
VSFSRWVVDKGLLEIKHACQSVGTRGYVMHFTVVQDHMVLFPFLTVRRRTAIYSYEGTL